MQTRPTRKWIYGLFVILGFFLLMAFLIGVLIAKHRAENERVRAEIEKRVAAIRAAGQPTTAQDLAKLYPDPPAEQDAALLLNLAMATLSIPEDSTNVPFFSLKLPRSAPLDQSAMAEAQHWLDKNQTAFALIPWNKLEHAWMGSGFTNGIMNLTAPPKNLTALSKLLCLSAAVQAEQQHQAEAMQSLEQAAIVGQTLKSDTQLHYLMKATTETLISKTLERVLNRVNLTNADLAKLPSFLTLTNIEATQETVMINEFPFTMTAASALQAGTSQLTKRALTPVGWLITSYEGTTLYRDQDFLNYLDWRDHCLAALNAPVSNAIPMLRHIDELKDELNTNAEKNRHRFLAAFRNDRASLFSMLAMDPSITPSLLHELSVVAQVRLAVAALAVERWRAAHGREAPASLAELTPDFLGAIPADPFDGQPLRFKKRAKGYVIYSIGEDLKDDGGKEKSSEQTGTNGYDITFTVEK